ncbi:MAG: hypothetical protein QG628_533 [Patescibacteria group bacterium]|jgi:hypothetical protein|nr:hypothetical protein [Patescibacteria group bacterium]
MNNLLSRLQNDYPDLTFVQGDSFYWSPQKNKIHYRFIDDTPESTWPLLHEVGHAQLGHRRYSTDFELLSLEIEAWEHAKKLAIKYDQNIDEDHIQDCLDTYRDWLYKRSTCPKCTNNSLQIETDTYRCHNCNNKWRVSASRKCRTYRKIQKAPITEAF